MISSIVYIATSIDGYIADKDGGMDWLSSVSDPENSDFGFARFMESIDSVVMGRATLKTVLSMNLWPYNKPVFVPSTSLLPVPEGFEDKIELIKGSPLQIIQNMRKRGYKNLYIDGGLTVQNFLKNNLIDEMIITTVPVLLGEGTPLFGKMPQHINFEHVLNT